MPKPGNEPFISSLIEPGDTVSYLESLISILHTFNMLILTLGLFLLYVVCYRFILKFNMDIVKKVLPVKLSTKIVN